jgi:hypothetical protein
MHNPSRSRGRSEEAEIRRIVIEDQPLQKPSEAPISTKKLGMGAYACNPSYAEK